MTTTEQILVPRSTWESVCKRLDVLEKRDQLPDDWMDLITIHVPDRHQIKWMKLAPQNPVLFKIMIGLAKEKLPKEWNSIDKLCGFAVFKDLYVNY